MTDYTFPENDVPKDTFGNPVSLGLEEETFYPVNSAGTQITTSTGSEQALYLPDDVECKYAYIQFKGTLSSYDPWDECSGFTYSSQSGGPAFLYIPPGKVFNVAKNKGDLLGYFTAPSDKEIVCVAIK